jgi:hypothetical protein
VVTLVAAALLLVARNAYRGDHDTNDGLALRPPPLPSASVVASAAPPSPSPILSAPPSDTTAIAAASGEPPPTASAPASSASAAPIVAEAPRPGRVMERHRVVTNDEPAAPVAPASASASTQPGISSESITQAAQRALEGKDRDEKEGTRAAQLAFLATQEDPGNADAWLTLGAAYEAMGKKQQAIESYRNCARKAQQHPRVSECRQLAGIREQ